MHFHLKQVQLMLRSLHPYFCSSSASLFSFFFNIEKKMLIKISVSIVYLYKLLFPDALQLL